MSDQRMKQMFKCLQSMKVKYLLWIVLWNTIVVTILLTFSELAQNYLLNHPPKKWHLAKVLHEYYREYDRKIIQLLPACSMYDDELTYRLRPGSCKFTNREFDIDISINSKGLRDDEESSVSPEIIVAGDSHAMGWGVEEYESFPSLVQFHSSKTVLNTAISSYGTARSIKLIENLDTSKLDWFIVQYCDNDYSENASFLANDNSLQPRTEAAYRDVSDWHVKNSEYYFGKYTIKLFPTLIRHYLLGERNEVNLPEEVNPKLEAKTFLRVLSTASFLNENIRIIVFEINKLGRNNTDFIDALRDEVFSGKYPNISKNMLILDVSKEVTREDYFTYDGHMAPSGHEIVSRMLCGIVGCGQKKAAD